MGPFSFVQVFNFIPYALIQMAIDSISFAPPFFVENVAIKFYLLKKII